MRKGIRALLLAGALVSIAAAPAPVDLSAKFGLRPGWQLLSTQGPDAEDAGGNIGPGDLHLCITADRGRTCRPALDDILTAPGGKTAFDTPHYLDDVRVVRSAAGKPLLWVQASSMHGGNGDQLVGYRLLAYDRAGDRFVTIYRKRTGHNNNQDVRFIGKGPLHGAIVSAEPTADAPYGFWITVNRMNRDGRYAAVLRYRSGTRYGDGNPLAVIDSEMPEILRRSRLWQPGQPLPLPDRKCPAPRLVGGVLWCAALPVKPQG